MHVLSNKQQLAEEYMLFNDHVRDCVYLVSPYSSKIIDVNSQFRELKRIALLLGLIHLVPSPSVVQLCAALFRVANASLVGVLPNLTAYSWARRQVG